MSLVSVVMPTHNSEKTIVKTIDSLIAQTYGNMELIAIDDASTDLTLALLEEKLTNDFRHDWRVIRLDKNSAQARRETLAWRRPRVSGYNF